MIDFPLCDDRHIFGRHGRGNFRVPSDKGVALSCRVGRGGDRRAVVLCNRCDLAAACSVKGNCVLIDFPLCSDRHIFGRHGRGNFHIPTDKGVALSCRVGRGGDRRVVILCNRCDLAAACGVKGNCVPVYCPLRIQGAVFRLVIPACAFTIAVTVAFAFNRGIIPAAEKVTGAYWHRHIAELFAVGGGHGFCYHFAAAGAIKGHRVGVRYPFSRALYCICSRLRSFPSSECIAGSFKLRCIGKQETFILVIKILWRKSVGPIAAVKIILKLHLFSCDSGNGKQSVGGYQRIFHFVKRHRLGHAVSHSRKGFGFCEIYVSAKLPTLI